MRRNVACVNRAVEVNSKFCRKQNKNAQKRWMKCGHMARNNLWHAAASCCVSAKHRYFPGNHSFQTEFGVFLWGATLIFQAQHVVLFHWAWAQNLWTFVVLLVILQWKHHKPHTIIHFFCSLPPVVFWEKIWYRPWKRGNKNRSPQSHTITPTQMHMVTNTKLPSDQKFMGFPFPVMTTIWTA